ncbi:cell division protein FtsL [Roseicella aerolata]|uniref:Cell division protein FtsL n=1 Tax=Roseicella aerolata TaxID=2883479 RepID=A0A9X1IH59_9PROT|nr:hypothetical protein [Roseicella aerolata]MCB4822995.1 hypothetical protein [Roseicella aerolata]
MILRPISLLTFTAAALAGLHLYQTKHEVALLDRELRGIARAIDEANDRTQALQAEWAWLNEPERLRGVAQRHLQLEPMQPAQFIRLNEAERRLPAVAAYDGPTALFAERAPAVPEGPVQLALLPRVPEPVQLARPAAPPVATPPVAAPAPAAQPVVLALPAAPPRSEAPSAPEGAAARPAPEVASPRPAAPPVVVARPAEAPRQLELPARVPESRPAPVEIARIAAPPRPVAPAPRPAPRQAPDVASLPPIAAPVRPAVAQVAPSVRPAATQVAPPPSAPVVRPAVTQLATAAPAAPRVTDAPAVSLGSALGGRSLLPPPVPFGSANASTLSGAGMR